MMKKMIFMLLLAFAGSLGLKAEVKDTIVVARDGTGKYRTISEALESCRAFMDYSIYIYVKKGTYKEKLIVPSWLENIIIEGEDVENTLITYDDHANVKDDHGQKLGTFRSYSMRVDGNSITFKNLTIENNAPQMGQAVALHTEGDKLVFINCRLLGNQDTIYTGRKNTRLYFGNCYIEGTTDYIFGPSTAWFEGCTLHCKRSSFITAASTPADVAYGYVFHNCKVTCADGVEKMKLGRPWRDYAFTYFIQCDLGDQIVPAGWHNWNRPECEKTVRYAEYGCTGVSAVTDQRVPWCKQLTKKEAAAVTLEKVFTLGADVWKPALN